MCASVVFGIFCILLPGIAWVVINEEWEFYIPVIDIVYKPWKLFLVVCALPALMCSLALLVLPESPKFVLAQGNQAETIQILQKINRWNNGGKKAKPLEITEIFEEFEAIENRKKIAENKNSRFPLLKQVWDQTAPLFQRPHLKTTMLACTIQFAIFATSNGMYMWFPDILNRMATRMSVNPTERVTLCNVVYSTRPNVTAMQAEEMVSSRPR